VQAAGDAEAHVERDRVALDQGRLIRRP
jgi:hypothetical protein